MGVAVLIAGLAILVSAGQDFQAIPEDAQEAYRFDLETNLYASDSEFDAFVETGAIAPSEEERLYPNACVLLRDDSPRARTALGRFRADKAEIRQLRDSREGIMSIRPRNKEQSFALDLKLHNLSANAIQLSGQ